MLFANSNIDTKEEFERRKTEAEKLARHEGVRFAAIPYDHEEWLREVAAGYEDEPEKGKRCARCFRYNLTKAAEYAAANGIESFTTSLTVSPHKVSSTIFSVAQTVATPSTNDQPQCVSFLPYDFKKKEGFKLSVKRAEALGLYRQSYCGCEFSKRHMTHKHRENACARFNDIRTVIVTGGTVRLGAAIAEGLRAAGWRVLTSSHRADAGADIVADLAEPLGPAKLYAEALKLLGGNPPDALVNNAALFTGNAATIAAVNYDAPKKLTMLMAGRESGMGAVVNILDSKVLNAKALSGTCSASPGYRDSKSGLLAFTHSAAATFAATLRVNAVAPGPVLAPTEVHEKAGECLLDRRPTAADVAAAVTYLLGAESVTGVVLPVDAGQHLLEMPRAAESLCKTAADDTLQRQEQPRVKA